MNYKIDERIDVKENVIATLDPKILRILLKDKSKEYEKNHKKKKNLKTNIIWATDDYATLGEGYYVSDEITVSAITGENGNVIKPRIEKSKEEQNARSKGKAEVFTPAWVCNKQNNLVDDAWLGYKNAFNTETNNGWVTNDEKIIFPNTKGKTWQDYVKANRLEISCGEAPYLASRYDTVTGQAIPVKERIGLLDRKLRVVSENTGAESEWVIWATKAVQSIYGYDWQGDNVLLARENILYTFAEHYEEKFNVPASKEYLVQIAKVAAWNIWQMDGIKYIVPNSCYDEANAQLDLFGYVVTDACYGCVTNDHSRHNGIYCRIYDWSHNASAEFYSFIKKGAR
jgi:hypothetical protein